MIAEHFPTLDMMLNWLSSGIVGAIIGWVHFRTLQWNTRLYIDSNDSSTWRALTLQVARIVASTVALYGCARVGLAVLPLLSGLLGARKIILRRSR